MPEDIRDRDDVARLVTEFYRRAFADPLLGHIFTDIAKMDLAHHLPIITDFWQTVLFRAGLYRRNALAIHTALDHRITLTPEHFDRWLLLWTTTVDDLFTGERADMAAVQARRIAGSIQRRLQGRSGSEYETLLTRDRLAERDT